MASMEGGIEEEAVVGAEPFGKVLCGLVAVVGARVVSGVFS